MPGTAEVSDLVLLLHVGAYCGRRRHSTTGPYSRHIGTASCWAGETTDRGRIRTRTVVLDPHADLLSPLDGLAQSIGLADGHLGDSVTELVAGLTTAVPSYCGLRLTFSRNSYPVVLSSFIPGLQQQPVTSLRAPLAAFAQRDGSSRPEIGSQVVFYATVAGALVDLAADLDYALGLGRAAEGDAAPVAVTLDDDLPVTDLSSGLTGLENVSTINRAVGLLIGRGHPPEEAPATLRQQATADGLALHLHAARILGR